MSKLAIVAAILPAAAWWWTNQPAVAQAAISEPGGMRSIIPVPTAKHGPTRVIRLSQCPCERTRFQD
jgi:hypothetical protein